MSVIVWIGLGAIAFILARTTVNHPLVLAGVLIVSSSWASPSIAADASVSATAVRVDTTDGIVTLHGTVSSRGAA